MHSWPPKDPDEVLDYQYDWVTLGRLEDGETITAFDHTVVPGTGTVVRDSQDEADGITTVWLSGGLAGEVNEINLHVVTSAGREYDETARLRIRDK